jgi:hypothetical protein
MENRDQAVKKVRSSKNKLENPEVESELTAEYKEGGGGSDKGSGEDSDSIADINEHDYNLLDSDIEKEPNSSWNGNEVMEGLKSEVY